MSLGIAISEEFVKKFGRKYPPEAFLTREGEKGDTMFILTSGKVAVYKSSSSGEKQIATLKDGDIFGEMALMGMQPFRSATVKSLQETMVLELNKTAFMALLRKSPEIGMSVMQTLVERLRDTNGKVVALSHNNGFKKVTAYLHHILNSEGVPAPERQIGRCAAIPIAQVASAVGVSADFVMKIMSKAIQANLLGSSGNWVWAPYPDYVEMFGDYLSRKYKEDSF